MSSIGHFAGIARKMQAVTPAGRAIPSQPELMKAYHSKKPFGAEMLLREYAKQNRQDMTSEGPKGGSLLSFVNERAWRVILVHVPAGPRDCLVGRPS